MLQKLIPNYALFPRVVGDADPYEFHRKNAFSVGNAVLSVPRNTVLIVVILGRCGHRTKTNSELLNHIVYYESNVGRLDHKPP